MSRLDAAAKACDVAAVALFAGAVAGAVASGDGLPAVPTAVAAASLLVGRSRIKRRAAKADAED